MGSCHITDARFVSESETLLEKARHQVHEGALRIVRQKAIVDTLDGDTNYRPQAALAREILACLHASFDALNSRLRAIEKRAKS